MPSHSSASVRTPCVARPPCGWCGDGGDGFVVVVEEAEHGAVDLNRGAIGEESAVESRTLRGCGVLLQQVNVDGGGDAVRPTRVSGEQGPSSLPGDVDDVSQQSAGTPTCSA